MSKVSLKNEIFPKECAQSTTTAAATIISDKLSLRDTDRYRQPPEMLLKIR